MSVPVTGFCGVVFTILPSDLVRFIEDEICHSMWWLLLRDAVWCWFPFHEIAIGSPAHWNIPHPEVVEINRMNRLLIRVTIS
ncbi:hypothetical protein G4Y79_04750 [Phototrophicus methaneseepsis]|uniref:Uncharacterized protein n=1 Tax=Phototrophicus methaneseepsis TaxID=2710758 RepID=A0A7S8EB23_9CHLR|nr:hypothetical protein G4Y79_04750 [Phototrophicus methaneseepsis]